MDHVDQIARSSERIAELITAENSNAKVPSCPEWTLLDLVAHIGEVQHFWANCIREGNANAPWQGEIAKPDSPRNAGDWLRTKTRLLIEAINSTPGDSPCWTWWDEPLTALAVARHQVQEAEVHRWDAELAVASPTPIPVEIAIDGIPEFLLVHRGAIQKLKLPHIQFSATDSADNWHVNEGEADTIAISGTASDLVLFLFGRRPLDKLSAIGKPEQINALVDALPEINY